MNVLPVGSVWSIYTVCETWCNAECGRKYGLPLIFMNLWNQFWVTHAECDRAHHSYWIVLEWIWLDVPVTTMIPFLVWRRSCMTVQVQRAHVHADSNSTGQQITCSSVELISMSANCSELVSLAMGQVKGYTDTELPGCHWQQRAGSHSTLSMHSHNQTLLMKAD